MAKQPGVMFYFETRPSLKRLSGEEKGRLFEAILDYGEFGEVPDFHGNLAFVWDFVQPRLDKDAQRYREISEKKRMAALARWEKQHADASDALQTMPTTYTPATTTTSSNAISASTPRGGRSPFRRWRSVERDERDFNTRRNAALDMLEEMAGEKDLPR